RSPDPGRRPQGRPQGARPGDRAVHATGEGGSERVRRRGLRDDMPPIQFVVDRRENGKTLAAVLKQRFGLSWSRAKRLVEGRHVKVGGQVETDVARRLKPGRRVELDAGTLEVKEAVKGTEKGQGKKPAPKKPLAAS